MANQIIRKLANARFQGQSSSSTTKTSNSKMAKPLNRTQRKNAARRIKARESKATQGQVLAPIPTPLPTIIESSPEDPIPSTINGEATVAAFIGPIPKPDPVPFVATDGVDGCLTDSEDSASLPEFEIHFSDSEDEAEDFFQTIFPSITVAAFIGPMRNPEPELESVSTTTTTTTIDTVTVDVEVADSEPEFDIHFSEDEEEDSFYDYSSVDNIKLAAELVVNMYTAAPKPPSYKDILVQGGLTNGVFVNEGFPALPTNTKPAGSTTKPTAFPEPKVFSGVIGYHSKAGVKNAKRAAKRAAAAKSGRPGRSYMQAAVAAPSCGKALNGLAPIKVGGKYLSYAASLSPTTPLIPVGFF